jgi:(p)ppGpp synthase/HD superfamily hydrolase
MKNFKNGRFNTSFRSSGQISIENAETMTKLELEDLCFEYMMHGFVEAIQKVLENKGGYLHRELEEAIADAKHLIENNHKYYAK